MSLIRDLFGSKKVITAMTATIVAAAGLLGLDLSVDQVALIVTPLAAFVVGQGVADHGKEAAKVAKEIKDAAPSALGPDARLDALEQWVRANATRLGAGSVPVGTATSAVGVPVR